MAEGRNAGTRKADAPVAVTRHPKFNLVEIPESLVTSDGYRGADHSVVSFQPPGNRLSAADRRDLMAEGRKAGT